MKIKDIEFEIIRSERKSLAVEVKREGIVIVRAPKKLKDKYILEFINNKYQWILSAKERQITRAEKYDFTEQEKRELITKAKNYIPKRTEYWSRITGLVPKAVKISSAKTRFGSCSGKNSLNFSFYLMCFPQEAIDYVIVHELAHIKHKNHSKSFYQLIAEFLPDYKERQKVLKR